MSVKGKRSCTYSEITEIKLYAEGKKDLRKNLLNRRIEQVSQGWETF